MFIGAVFIWDRCLPEEYLRLPIPSVHACEEDIRIEMRPDSRIRDNAFSEFWTKRAEKCTEFA